MPMTFFHAWSDGEGLFLQIVLYKTETRVRTHQNNNLKHVLKQHTQKKPRICTLLIPFGILVRNDRISLHRWHLRKGGTNLGSLLDRA